MNWYWNSNLGVVGSAYRRELKEGRLRIPVFQDDACRWLIQIQQHFDMKKEGKLQLVVKVLEGHAYDWYKQWGVSNPKVSWEELQMSVLKKFQARYDLNLPVRVQGKGNLGSKTKGKMKG
ncbi:hypothetical protein JHK85_015191 [Glycine max]|nr:hypothetical protein JHK85_015191 [Glycine max]